MLIVMLNLESTNNRLIIALSTFIAILLCGYFNLFVNFICLIVIGTCVFSLTLNFLNDSNSRAWLTNCLLDRFDLKVPHEPINVKESNEVDTKKQTPFALDFPWNGTTLPKSLNLALEHFANSLIEDYVNRWYKEQVSADNTFLLEIKYQIRYGSATAVRALRNYNFAELIQTELLPLVVLHVNRVSKLLDSLDEGTVSVEEQLAHAFVDDLHIAMYSRENSEHYLSEIADHLVACLLDDSRIGGRELDGEVPATYKATNWPSEACRHFLRQLVLSTILVPIMDFITNPDTLNRLVITALDPAKSELEDTSKDERVPFLENLSKHCQADVPDSLLVLKLSDLIRDPRLLQIFDGYLRDIQGPTHWLDCFLQTNDVLHRLQAIKDEKSGEFFELYSDIWQLYSAFVHKSAKAQIELFSDELLANFSLSIENKSHSGLLKAVEEIYMILYHEINYNYVVAFCQSESYLGYLCGTSAEAEDLFQEDEQVGIVTGADEEQSTGLSIAQIPAKIWNVLRGDFGDDSEEQSKDATLVEESVQTNAIEEMIEDQIEDEMKPIDAIDSSFLEVDDFAFDQTIDMNQWKISVPLVERRRRFKTGMIYFVYILAIERNEDNLDASSSQCCSRSSLQNGGLTKNRSKKQIDESDEEDDEERQIEEYEAMSQLPKAWSIARTYDEFYAFDRRLRQHFGVNAQPFALLPDRKMMCPRNQKFLESQRQYMEAFLQKLTSQPNLKHSELFFAFLTNPGESGFENSLISAADIDAANTATRRRSQEVQSDDGEYLKPFISRLLAKALANDDTYVMGVPEEPNKFETYSLDSGTYSLLPDGISEHGNDQLVFSKLLRTNPHFSHSNALLDNVEQSKQMQALTIFESLSKNITLLATYLLNLMFIPHEYFKFVLLTLIDLFSGTLNKLFGRTLTQTMDIVLDEATILYIVKALHEVVFDEHREEMSQEEVKQRSKQAEQLLNDWLLPRFIHSVSKSLSTRTQLTIHRIFQCFQYTTLNRQLAFVLTDKLAQHILPPDLDTILTQLHLESQRKNST